MLRKCARRCWHSANTTEAAALVNTCDIFVITAQSKSNRASTHILGREEYVVRYDFKRSQRFLGFS